MTHNGSMRAKDIAIVSVAMTLAALAAHGFTQELGDAERAKMIGQPAPELNVSGWTNTDGKELSSADLKGKVVVLDFYSYGCSECMAAVPRDNAIYAKYKSQGFVFIGVHLTFDPNAHEALLMESKFHDRVMKTQPFQFPACDDKLPFSDSHSTNAIFHVTMMPTVIVIGRNGKIVCYDPPDLEKAIKSALGG